MITSATGSRAKDKTPIVTPWSVIMIDDLEAVPDQALKKDMGKPRWDLLPLEAVEGIVKVLTFGASKYEDNGWKGLGDQQERIHAAVMRHYTALRKGETIDSESGLPHLDHMMCNLMFLKFFSLQEEKRGSKAGLNRESHAYLEDICPGD
jgi:hypothetical protein